MSNLNDKVNQYFPGLVVKKDLVKKFHLPIYNFIKLILGSINKHNYN